MLKWLGERRLIIMISFDHHGLRDRRIAAGYGSQRQLAQAVGVTRQCVSNWESGCNTPFTVEAIHLARALRCTVEDLFTETPARSGVA